MTKREPGFVDRMEDLDLAVEQCEFKKDDLLRKAGWEHTSSTPGCLWLWRKKIRGAVYLVTKEAAIHITKWTEEFEK